MWLNKFLDLEDDIEQLRSKIEENIFKKIKKTQLTPLQFTVLETIFNAHTISGYDLIKLLNKQFAKTWKASSGTIYPILSKLEKNGYLTSKQVKSPIGPLRTVYSLTDAGKQIIKTKVNKNFQEQLNYIENFVTELSLIYIKSFPKEVAEQKTEEVKSLLKQIIDNIIERIPVNMKFPSYCPQCGSKLDKQGIKFCAYCGADLKGRVS